MFKYIHILLQKLFLARIFYFIAAKFIRKYIHIAKNNNLDNYLIGNTKNIRFSLGSKIYCSL